MRRFANGKNYHDTGHLLKTPAKACFARPCAGFSGRTATALRQFQVTEYGAQLVHHGGRQGDGPRTGRAGRGGGHRARCAQNPILLKPTSDVGSQVIIMGEAQGNRTAREYWGRKKALLPIIKDAFDSLAAENDIIVIEGAGSPAEINLKQDDIVNMGLAKLVDAPVLLVGDIDRGGVFASLYGTVKLLEEDEQARIRGLIINKFRGDVEILRPGLTARLEIDSSRSIGVVP